MATLAASTAMFSGYAVLYLVLTHCRCRMGFLSRHLVSAVGAHVVGVLMLAAMPITLSYWEVSAHYAVAVLCWFFGTLGIFRSVSLRMLTTGVAESSLRRLEEVALRITVTECEARFNDLLRQGYAVRANDSLVPSAKGLAIGERLRILRRMFGMTGGLYFGQADR